MVCYVCYATFAARGLVRARRMNFDGGAWSHRFAQQHDFFHRAGLNRAQKLDRHLGRARPGGPPPAGPKLESDPSRPGGNSAGRPPLADSDSAVRVSTRARQTPGPPLARSPGSPPVGSNATGSQRATRSLTGIRLGATPGNGTESWPVPGPVRPVTFKFAVPVPVGPHAHTCRCRAAAASGKP